MPDCADCSAMAGAPVTVSPHANLLLHSEANINFGATATGRIEYYVCHACHAQWERERARVEPDAVWQHARRVLE